MKQERNEFSSVIENAEENRKEILIEIDNRLQLIESVIKSCETMISKQLEHSIKNDFFFEPKLAKYNGFISWKELLLRYRKAVENISITPDDLMGQSGTILEDAGKLIELIDSSLVPKQNEFIKENLDLFEEGQTKKHKIEKQIIKTEMRRDGIMLLKQNNDNKKQDLQLQVDNLKFKFWKRKERKKYMAEAVAYEQGEIHTTEVINELGQQIDDLKRDLKEARYNHGGIDIQGRTIKVNFMNKTNSSDTEVEGVNSDEAHSEAQEESIEL